MKITMQLAGGPERVPGAMERIKLFLEKYAPRDHNRRGVGFVHTNEPNIVGWVWGDDNHVRYREWIDDPS